MDIFTDEELAAIDRRIRRIKRTRKIVNAAVAVIIIWWACWTLFVTIGIALGFVRFTLG